MRSHGEALTCPEASSCGKPRMVKKIETPAVTVLAPLGLGKGALVVLTRA